MQSTKSFLPPENAILYETPISTHWFDEDGIFCAVSKPVERTIAHYQSVMELYQQFTPSRGKLLLLANNRNTMAIPKEVSEFITQEMPKHIKAHAIVVENQSTEFITRTLMKLSFAAFPIMLFTSVEEAKEWLLKRD